jgi:uncharacterized protein YukJ
MPIRGYGVLRGRPTQAVDATNKSPHYQVRIAAAKQQYRIAVNVRSQQKPDEVLYYVEPDFRHDMLANLLGADQGFTPLKSEAGGLALDFVRDQLFDTSRMRPLPLGVAKADNDLNHVLDSVIQRAIGASDAEVFAFGQGFPGPDEPEEVDEVFAFSPEAGIHDIHMNQGNSSRFAKDDGTWQDGGLLVHVPKADRWVAVFLAFQSQSFQTNDDGHAVGTSRTARLRKRRHDAARPMAPVGEPLGVAAVHTPAQAPAPPAQQALDGLEWPPTRSLRVYAFDPSRGRLLGNEMSVDVRRVELLPGPVVKWENYGDRLAVVDYDGASGCYYRPVNLDDPRVLMGAGLPPSESDPRFHQQMVYAVASETVEHFEAALGRRIHWRRAERDIHTERGFKQDDIITLHLFPHAFRSPNAFYSPDAHGILFGYFRADGSDVGRNLPGQPVFTCLSHDIVVHETTHAVLDGIRAYFLEQTNVDVPAFHEAFADLAALFRHFTHREVLADTMQRTGGRLFDYQLKPDATTDAGATPPPGRNGSDLERAGVITAQISARNPLIELAEQFGEASGLRRGLRSALGTPPTPEPLKRLVEPHARGSILVAAVFDAFFSTYVARTSDLFRIFRAGGGSQNPVDLPGPLAGQLCTVASRTADEFFALIARALDYCPPVDITFGDFLRAVITAHWDHDEADAEGIRNAWMQAFRLRGIQATGARFFSESALRWPTGADLDLPQVPGLEFGDPSALTNQQKAVIAPILRQYASRWDVLTRLGLDPDDIDAVDVPSFHPVFRVQRDGSLRTEMVVEIVQTHRESRPGGGSLPFRSGATLILQHTRDSRGRGHASVRYAIAKPCKGDDGEKRRSAMTGFADRHNLFDPDDGNRLRIDFAMVHGGTW